MGEIVDMKDKLKNCGGEFCPFIPDCDCEHCQLNKKQDELSLTPEEKAYVTDKARLIISSSMGWTDKKKMSFVADEVAKAQLAKLKAMRLDRPDREGKNGSDD